MHGQQNVKQMWYNRVLYWSILRPIVTYVCEAWVLRETIKYKLMTFEREVLRKIFGPTK